MRRIVAVALVVLSPALTAQEPPSPGIAALRAGVERAEGLVKEGKLPEAREAVRVVWKMTNGVGQAAEGEQFELVWRLGTAAYRSGDLRTAHDVCVAVEAPLARALPDDDALLLAVRQNLAAAKSALGDVRGALALDEKLFEIRSRILSDDDFELQSAREGLATTRMALGDVRGALPLLEKVFEVRSRLLPDDHLKVQDARQNLAVAKMDLGDLRGALALLQRVFEVRSRLLPDDHLEVQDARQNLAVAKKDLGDLRGALVLEETVLEARSRLLPDDHPQLQMARQNLANTKSLLGDRRGALALLEQVSEVLSRQLAEDHPKQQAIRLSLATLKHDLGDLHSARALREKAFDVLSGQLPVDHRDLQVARLGLAETKRGCGDLVGALELETTALVTWSRLLPDDHPDMQTARNNLAVTKILLGDLRGALALMESVLEVRSRLLPAEHPALHRVRLNVVRIYARLADTLALPTHERALDAAAGARGALARSIQAPRGLAALAESMHVPRLADTLASFVVGCGTLSPTPGLGAPLLLILETLRGIEARSARLLRHALAESGRAEVTALSEQTRAVSNEIVAIAYDVPKNGEDREAWSRARELRRVDVVLRKEKIERQIVETLQPARGCDPATVTTANLAARLPEGAAAVSLLAYTHTTIDPDAPHQSVEERRALALLLTRDGEVRSVPLGPLARIESAVARIRRAVGADVPASTEPGQGSPLVELRKLVMAPILAALSDAHTLYLSLDESLHLVPMDALPDDQGNPIGARVELRQLVSLFELLEREPAIDPDASAGLVAFGGIDFTGRDGGPAEPRLDVFAPITSERSGEGGAFLALAGSSAEVDTIGALFAQAIPDGKAVVHKGKAATKGQLFAAATGARYLHLATHGYFAPEWVRSSADPTPEAMDPLREHRGATGLSPLVLAGLALAGANLPPDALGRHEGIATAEELLHLDLRQCELVTLSACDSSLGVRRAGQGYASLRAALLGAGARRVVASLWRVDDAVTRDLMVDFYRRLWVEKKTPHAALWEARMAVREKHPAFRHWAGWVLVGK